jgi:hypothetical protein
MFQVFLTTDYSYATLILTILKNFLTNLSNYDRMDLQTYEEKSSREGDLNVCPSLCSVPIWAVRFDSAVKGEAKNENNSYQLNEVVFKHHPCVLDT